MHAADGATGLQVFKLHDSLLQAGFRARAPKMDGPLAGVPPGGVRRLLALSVR